MVRTGTTFRWVGAALVAAVVAGACSGGPSRSTEAFCDELNRGASELDEQTAAAGDDLGAQFELVVANIGDFTRLLHRLNERAPDEIRSDMSAAVELWDEQADRAADAASDPLGALASVLMQSVMTAPSIEAVDAFAVENCGRVLFGVAAPDDTSSTTERATSDTTSNDRNTTPYINDEGYTVIDASNLFGSSPCQTRGAFVAALTATRFVIDCDQGQYIGIDLDAEEVMWSAHAPTPADDEYGTFEPPRVLSTKAALMAFADIEIDAATGFDVERREVVVRAWSLEDGSEQYDVALPRPEGAIDEIAIGDSFVNAQPRLEVMGADGTVIVGMNWPVVDGYPIPMLYGITPDGSIAWQKPSDQYVFVVSNAQSREYVETTQANTPPDVISIQTGTSAIPAGVPSLDDADSAFGDGCSSIFALLTESSLTVLDARSGLSHTEELGGSTGDIVPTSRGVYFDPHDEAAESLFIGPEGVVWRQPPRVSSSAETVFGRLFMQNQSGTLLEVDQATGEPLSTSEEAVPPRDANAVEGGVVLAQDGMDGLWIRFEETQVLCG